MQNGPEPKDAGGAFSATEILIAPLRLPIIMGCWVLLPLIVIVWGVSFIEGVPMSTFGDPSAQIAIYILTFITGPFFWILNRLLPKRTISYAEGIFTIERNGRSESFTKGSVARLAADHSVMPDYIRFYIKGREQPLKFPMKGFRTDDRFDVPRKIICITGVKLTEGHRQMLDDFDR